MSEHQLTLVKHAAWGKMEVTVGSETSVFRDCKVWHGGAVEWDWRLTDTRHRPGIQPADIEEILQHAVDVMVLARGRSGASTLFVARSKPVAITVILT